MEDHASVSRPAALRLTLACQLSAVRAVGRTVHSFLAQQGCAQDDIVASELALVEACNNAIQYAKGEQVQQPVHIEVLCDLKEITLQITDHTSGFEWPIRPAFPSPESEGGRGLPLIQALTDYSEYQRGGHGNILRLRKQRSPNLYSTALR